MDAGAIENEIDSFIVVSPEDCAGREQPENGNEELLDDIISLSDSAVISLDGGDSDSPTANAASAVIEAFEDAVRLEYETLQDILTEAMNSVHASAKLEAPQAEASATQAPANGNTAASEVTEQTPGDAKPADSAENTDSTTLQQQPKSAADVALPAACTPASSTAAAVLPIAVQDSSSTLSAAVAIADVNNSPQSAQSTPPASQNPSTSVTSTKDAQIAAPAETQHPPTGLNVIISSHMLLALGIYAVGLAMYALVAGLSLRSAAYKHNTQPHWPANLRHIPSHLVYPNSSSLSPHAFPGQATAAFAGQGKKRATAVNLAPSQMVPALLQLPSLAEPSNVYAGLRGTGPAANVSGAVLPKATSKAQKVQLLQQNSGSVGASINATRFSHNKAFSPPEPGFKVLRALFKLLHSHSCSNTMRFGTQSAFWALAQQATKLHCGNSSEHSGQHTTSASGMELNTAAAEPVQAMAARQVVANVASASTVAAHQQPEPAVNATSSSSARYAGVPLALHLHARRLAYRLMAMYHSKHQQDTDVLQLPLLLQAMGHQPKLSSNVSTALSVHVCHPAVAAASWPNCTSLHMKLGLGRVTGKVSASSPTAATATSTAAAASRVSAAVAAAAIMQRIASAAKPVPPLYRPAAPCLLFTGADINSQVLHALGRGIQGFRPAAATPHSMSAKSPADASSNGTAQHAGLRSAVAAELTLPMLPPVSKQQVTGGLTLPMLPPVTCAACSTQLQLLPASSSKQLSPLSAWTTQSSNSNCTGCIAYQNSIDSSQGGSERANSSSTAFVEYAGSQWVSSWVSVPMLLPTKGQEKGFNALVLHRRHYEEPWQRQQQRQVYCSSTASRVKDAVNQQYSHTAKQAAAAVPTWPQLNSLASVAGLKAGKQVAALASSQCQFANTTAAIPSWPQLNSPSAVAAQKAGKPLSMLPAAAIAVAVPNCNEQWIANSTALASQGNAGCLAKLVKPVKLVNPVRKAKTAKLVKAVNKVNKPAVKLQQIASSLAQLLAAARARSLQCRIDTAAPHAGLHGAAASRQSKDTSVGGVGGLDMVHFAVSSISAAHTAAGKLLPVAQLAQQVASSGACHSLARNGQQHATADLQQCRLQLQQLGIAVRQVHYKLQMALSAAVWKPQASGSGYSISRKGQRFGRRRQAAQLPVTVSAGTKRELQAGWDRKSAARVIKLVAQLSRAEGKLQKVCSQLA